MANHLRCTFVALTVIITTYFYSVVFWLLSFASLTMLKLSMETINHITACLMMQGMRLGAIKERIRKETDYLSLIKMHIIIYISR